MALRYPSPAAELVPRLVLGPMAGALPNPPAFAGEMAGEPWYMKLRALDGWRFAHDPVLRRSMASASVVIGAADYVRDVLRNVPVRRFEVMPEHGVAELLPAPPRPSSAPGSLRGVFVGRVIRTKGLRDAIRALARLADLPHVTLDVAGDGPDRADCEAEALRLGVAGRVRFHGWMARADIDTLYGQADAFVFPSFREPSGAVVVEAMSHGLPAIVADYGGPSSLAGPDAAIRVPVRDPDQYAAALADAMRALAGDPARRAAMGETGRRRVAERFLWPAKIRWLERVYEEVIAQS
jgi:glycosyltransferase involved in cell wall biosynthesis